MRQSFMENKRIFILIFIILVLSKIGGNKAMQVENNNEKVYIYLVNSSVKSSVLNTIKLSDIPLEKSFFISSDDVEEYNSENHTFLLTDQAYAKVFELNVPVEGRPFVVTVNDKRIYLGCFWTDFSSIPYDGIVIIKPKLKGKDILKIQLGYPNKKFFKKQDHRNNNEVLEILKDKQK